METSTKTKVYRFVVSRDGSYWMVMEVATSSLVSDLTFSSLGDARQWCLDNGHGFLDYDN